MFEKALINQSPQASRDLMLANVSLLDTQSVALFDSVGRTLREDIVATFDQPPFDASSMDGYALASDQSPASFEIIATSSAGTGSSATLLPRQTVRIFTGAPLPIGSDSVVMQEDVNRIGDTVTIPKVTLGQNVRPKGVDFKTGQTLLVSGMHLDAISAALIAATGINQVVVSRQPRISILSGGDEIVMPGQIRGPHQIYDSITIAMKTLIESWGGVVQLHAPARDDLTALERSLVGAFEGVDLVVTIGGASVGDKDLMKPALSVFEPIFLVDKIALRPGKPTWFAATKLGAILGLPGNPSSALVCAHLFLRPIMLALLGQGATQSPAFSVARLRGLLPQNGPREHYLRAKNHIDENGQAWVTPAEIQDSSLLSVFAGANCLIRQIPNGEPLAYGSWVHILPL